MPGFGGSRVLKALSMEGGAVRAQQRSVLYYPVLWCAVVCCAVLGALQDRKADELPTSGGRFVSR